MAGQKLLLALLVASLISYAIAAALKPPHAGNGGGDYRTFQAAGHANSSGAGTKGGASALEDELSNSALQVLRQMEDIEVRSGPAQLASVAEEDEERGEEALGKGSKSRPAKASTHSAGRHRSSAHRSGHRGGSMRGGMGSSYAPRTSISLVNKTLSMTAQSRTSSYAEPHLDTKASSVAFSFYDGGDSDDDDDGDAPIPAPPSAGTGPAVPSKDAKRGMTYEAARAALEFAVLLGVCVVGEHRMPSGRLPAGTTLDSENPDLWAFIMALLFLVSLLNVEVLEEGTEVFLSRAQANEWKGWMQVAFVAYRRGVRRCAGASAAGRRGTPWIEYYFVALATVHFVLIWVSLAIARVIGTLVGWEKPDKKEHREACYAEKALGCALMIGLCCIIWLDPHNDGKGVYDVLLRPWLLDIDGEHYFEWYFWMRTKMDFLSSVPGLCFAAVYTPFRDAWPFGISRLARWGMGACASTLIALAIWVSQLPQYCCDGGADYRSVNPYVGTLWIPFYLLARNAIPALSRRIMKPIEWVGMHSLEFYLLQFHVFLTDGSHQILYIIPKEDWGYTNMLLVGCIYFVCGIKALEITNVLRAAWARPGRRARAGVEVRECGRVTDGKERKIGGDRLVDAERGRNLAPRGSLEALDLKDDRAEGRGVVVARQEGDGSAEEPERDDRFKAADVIVATATLGRRAVAEKVALASERPRCGALFDARRRVARGKLVTVD
ncbi:N-acetylneuraminate 7-O(or 9-O)-acetyltransferase [Aureococcus anophagefferens]|uniref:N-acetylneuraminate 7-O(Or 9-O)-acetyltransferase n=1 Tax=Aureococcus anophagefferens TaxID=44056 RepID=A0ABR1FM58_AURAN